jgi:signal peptidase I
MFGKNKKEHHKEKEVKKPKTMLGKLWHFIWYDNSIYSWILNIVLAVIIIKFIVYPGLGLLFGTGFPVVAVVSSSMEHNESFDSWWVNNQGFYNGFGINKEQFSNFDFKNGFNKGDIIILIGKKPEDINVGNVIVFQSNKPYPIIHRVINKKVSSFETKGDNNNGQIREYFDPNTKMLRNFPVGKEIPSGWIMMLDETNITHKQLVGKAVLKIPYLGYIKIGFVNFLHIFGIYSLG